jgi:hypothetical protein
MPMFIDANQRVPVTRGANTIWIKAKMDLGTRSAVLDEIRTSGGKPEDADIHHLGQYRLALMQHNIVAWEGPAFEGMPCTRGNIARLDPTDPLVEAVADEIGQRNAPSESPDPNAPAPSGSTGAGDSR